LNTLKRNKSVLYHSKRINDNGIIKFEIPKEKHLNYQPTNSSEDISAIGENYFMYLRIICNKEEALLFNTGDRCYVYKDKPLVHDDLLCSGADYVVDGIPLITLNSGEIKLKRLSGN